jgi:hypothetical protein
VGAHEENCRGVSRGINDTVSDAPSSAFGLLDFPLANLFYTTYPKKKINKKNCFYD